jgi:hypothetical protein
MVGRARAEAPAPPPAEFQFVLHAQHFHVPADLAAYARGKLETKLRKFGARVTAVILRLRDDNGPRGGAAICCHAEALLAGLEPVNVDEREADLRAALDVGIEHLDLAVQRHIERARARPRNQGRKVVRHRKLAQTT